MNKYVLALTVLVGFSMGSLALADESRTIPYKSKGVAHANTVVSSAGADLLRIYGYASSANCVYSVHDTNTFALSNPPSASNVKTEGGEATQYDSIVTADFGDEGLRFTTGIAVATTTCDLAVLYR